MEQFDGNGRTTNKEQFYQNVIVMRHGDRLDNEEPMWEKTAARRWDPPLHEKGKVRAFSTGRRLRVSLQFPIHRVFVSPFHRCIETAYEVVSALCAVPADHNDLDKTSSKDVAIDSSKIKVSVEFGLSEMLNDIAIRSANAPKDRNFGFDILKCEALLPAGTVDHTAERVYEKLPEWGEKRTVAAARYEHVINALANKYPSENLLLVTHGEGVGVAFSKFNDDAQVYEVPYCAYEHIERAIHFDEKSVVTAGDFMHKAQSGDIRSIPKENS